jgi:Membrane proteins related to metalloendopeptidases
VNDEVGKGQQIGKIGTSGNARIFRGTAEEHLHFEYLPPGCNSAACATDPTKFLNSPCPAGV